MLGFLLCKIALMIRSARVARPEVIRRAWLHETTPFGLPQGVPPLNALPSAMLLLAVGRDLQVIVVNLRPGSGRTTDAAGLTVDAGTALAVRRRILEFDRPVLRLRLTGFPRLGQHQGLVALRL